MNFKMLLSSFFFFCGANYKSGEKKRIYDFNFNIFILKHVFVLCLGKVSEFTLFYSDSQVTSYKLVTLQRLNAVSYCKEDDYTSKRKKISLHRFLCIRCNKRDTPLTCCRLALCSREILSEQ